MMTALRIQVICMTESRPNFFRQILKTERMIAMNFKVGDTVHFIDPYFNARNQGVIERLNASIAEVKYTCKITGYERDKNLWVDNLYQSEYELEVAMKNKSDKEIDKFMKRVTTQEEALRFIYDYCGGNTEYPDLDADEAGKRMALKYFGIEIS